MPNEFVDLYWKRNRGWPLPDDSWGLGPMFGDDGWCHSCGTPLREQCGPLTLRRKNLTPVGAWIPNWRFNAICMAGSLARNVIAGGITINLRKVAWKSEPPEPVFQIVAPTVGNAWFDPTELRAQAEERHGIASPEWFGAGCQSFRQILVRRRLAELITAASPRDFTIQELP